MAALYFYRRCGDCIEKTIYGVKLVLTGNGRCNLIHGRQGS